MLDRHGLPEAYQLALLVPGDMTLRTGGYGYDRAMLDGLRLRGWRVRVCGLDDSYPFPCADARDETRRTLAALPDGMPVLADGLAFGAMADEAEAEADRLRFVALVHHPLALESGLDPSVAARLFDTERRALRTARGVVVTSPATRLTLEPYGVPADRIAVVPPGTDPAPLARGTRGMGGRAAIELLVVASLTPRKGYDVLFQALAPLAHLPWHLTCAGSAHLNPHTAADLFGHVAEAGFTARVSFPGELDEAALHEAYDRADLFVLPTRFEGYGMAVAEAVARGLPVVSTPTGAIPDLVDASSGVLVPIGDVPALRDALERLIVDDVARAGLAEGARRRRSVLPTWDDAVGLMAAALLRYTSDGIVQR